MLSPRSNLPYKAALWGSPLPCQVAGIHVVALVSGGEVVALAELHDVGGVMQHTRYSTASIDNKKGCVSSSNMHACNMPPEPL